MADITLTIGQILGGNLKLIDAVTGNEVSATFSNQQVSQNTNPDAANIFVNPTDQNRINAQGLAVGSGTVQISAHADYVDAGNGLPQSHDFTITKTFEVVGNPNGVTFVVNFG